MNLPQSNNLHLVFYNNNLSYLRSAHCMPFCEEAVIRFASSGSGYGDECGSHGGKCGLCGIPHCHAYSCHSQQLQTVATALAATLCCRYHFCLKLSLTEWIWNRERGTLFIYRCFSGNYSGCFVYVRPHNFHLRSDLRGFLSALFMCCIFTKRLSRQLPDRYVH